jgi:dihydroorotase
MAALQTLLPLTLKLVEEGAMDLSRAVATLTTGPAAVLGLDAGTLRPGAVADVCVFDPAAAWTVNGDTWLSAGRNTPYWGQTVMGRVTHTLLAGRQVFPFPEG